MRRADPPGYVAPYRKRHKPLTVTLTNEEHAKFSAIAACQGLTPTAWATDVLRDELAKEAVE